MWGDEGWVYKMLVAPVAAVFVAWLGGKAWRNHKRNTVENAMDSAEIGMLDRYRAERDQALERADRAYAERNTAIEEMYQLRERVRNLTVQVEDLKHQLGVYQTRVEELIRLRREDGP